MGSLGQKISRTVAVAAFFALAFSTKVMAIPLAVVGNVDSFVTACNGLPSGDANEIACLEGVTGVGSVSAIQKFSQNPSDGELLLELQFIDEDPNIVAFLLPVEWRGGYFLLKTGNLTPGPGGPTISSYIMQNLSSTAYAVFNVNDPDFPIALGQIDKLSHLTAFQLVETPLPAAVWMFMAALGGLFGIRKMGAKRRAS